MGIICAAMGTLTIPLVVPSFTCVTQHLAVSSVSSRFWPFSSNGLGGLTSPPSPCHRSAHIRRSPHVYVHLVASGRFQRGKSASQSTRARVVETLLHMFRLVPGVQLLSLCCTDCGRHRLCHVRCHAAHPHSTVQRDTCLSSVRAGCPHSRPASIKHWDHQSRSVGRGIYLEVKPDLLCDRLEPSLHPSTTQPPIQC